MSDTVKKLGTENILDRYINDLIRGNGEELNTYLTQVNANQQIGATKAISRCYMVSSDGQHLPRIDDFALHIAAFMLDYAIPRSEIDKAKQLDVEQNTTVNTTKLKIKARKLFTNLKKTGEGGELLLYLLIQSVLKLPQAISKMSLKTSGQLHYQGADAVHLGFDSNSQKMLLYWGEAKLYQSIDRAVKNCFESLAPYLISKGGVNNPRERDMQLLLTNLDLANPELEKALVNYLNPDHPAFNSVEYRAACLMGFDEVSYCSVPFSKAQEVVLDEMKQSLAHWVGKLDKGIQGHRYLDKFAIDVFLVPFPSVQKFRDAFLEAISNV